MQATNRLLNFTEEACRREGNHQSCHLREVRRERGSGRIDEVETTGMNVHNICMNVGLPGTYAYLPERYKVHTYLLPSVPLGTCLEIYATKKE
jgi:hypothetical protein